MKKNLLIASALVLISGSVFLNGCKKDDTTAPVVTLSGSSSMTISLNSTFTDPGATANDDKDGSVTVTTSGTVDKDTKGDYTLTYSATDAAGNIGSATRTVHVVNDAESLAANYNVKDSVISISNTIYYTSTITTDAHVNKRFHFSHFVYADNTTIFGMMTSSTTFDIPSQHVTAVGSALNDHTYNGTGVIAGSNFSFTYTDQNTSNSNSAPCIAYYIKI